MAGFCIKPTGSTLKPGVDANYAEIATYFIMGSLSFV